MKRSVLVLALVTLGGVARAEPMTAVKVTESELRGALVALTEQLDEPVGLRVTSDRPKLGLLHGDVVVAIDGQCPLGGLGMWDERRPIVYLDVRRGKRELVVRVQVVIGTLERDLERESFERTIAEQRQFVDTVFVPATRGGSPSGVMVRMPTFDLGFEQGDLVRRVDGKAVTTGTELLDALDAAKADAKLQIDVERLGQPVQVTLVLEDPPKEDIELADLAAKIRKLDATTYEVPKTLVDAIVANPMAASGGTRVVPAIRDGKSRGFKLYAIRPSSLAAALGFANGDTIVAINGEAMDSLDKAVDAFTKLPAARSVKIDVERRGKTLTLEYRIE